MKPLEALVIGRSIEKGEKNYKARLTIAGVILSRADQINLTQLSGRKDLQQFTEINLNTNDAYPVFADLKPDFVIYIVDDKLHKEGFYLYHLAYTYYEHTRQKGRILLIMMSDKAQEPGLGLTRNVIIWGTEDSLEKLDQFIDQM